MATDRAVRREQLNLELQRLDAVDLVARAVRRVDSIELRQQRAAFAELRGVLRETDNAIIAKGVDKITARRRLPDVQRQLVHAEYAPTPDQAKVEALRLELKTLERVAWSPDD